MESNGRDRRRASVDYRRRVDVLAAIENAIRARGNRLMESYPSLSPPLLWAWSAYVYLYVRTVAFSNSIGHEASIVPFELFWVDVDRIEYMAQPRPRSKYKYVGRVTDGDWDRDHERFSETDVYRAFCAHFERGVDWEDTTFFDRVVARIAEGERMWGCGSRAEFEQRCVELDELYESIERHGYMTQAELAESDVDEPIAKGHTSKVLRLVYDEMTVSVARDGELIFNDGRDRLAIAKLLGLQEVPVWIMQRHAEWQRLRDELATGEVDREELTEELRTHPDLEGPRR